MHLNKNKYGNLCTLFSRNNFFEVEDTSDANVFKLGGVLVC